MIYAERISPITERLLLYLKKKTCSKKPKKKTFFRWNFVQKFGCLITKEDKNIEIKGKAIWCQGDANPFENMLSSPKGHPEVNNRNFSYNIHIPHKSLAL